ncbi:hypothetical protein [Microbacterium karelineae]|uniref:hypothetical protein n=1 Tax=Microbacterium karelineae TaxID=2654283 RepID=UPI0012EABA1D|nr:hypothetical protein [Microbacterium karelineae]
MSRRIPVLRAVFAGAAVCGAVALVAALIGAVVAGPSGAGTGALAGAVGLAFPGLTAVVLAILRRRFSAPDFAAIAWVSFLALFLVKVVVFVACLLLLLAPGWTHAGIAYGALAVAGVVSLAIDLVLANGIRVAPSAE